MPGWWFSAPTCRLAPTAEALGLYAPAEAEIVARRASAQLDARAIADATVILPEQVASLLDAAGSSPITQPLRLVELARRQGITLDALFGLAGVGTDLPREAVVTADLEIKYEGYFERERVQADRMRRMGELLLDPDLPYGEMQSLTYEARQKLLALRPASLAQASRIPGVSPNDLQNLVIEVEKNRRLMARG